MAEAAAHAAAIARAIKASGTIVRVTPIDFQQLLNRQDEPLVVSARGGLFNSKWCYLTSYKGLAFFTKSPEALLLPGRALVVEAQSVWMPG